jgi:KDO2-lipid IV(A) lauroyltransferase
VNGTGRALFRIAAAVLDSLPGRLRSLAADLSAFGSYCLSPVKRRNVQCNLSVVEAPPSGGKVLGIFRNHSMNLIEMFTSSRWNRDEIRGRIDFPDRHLLDEAVGAGRGVIIATAHVGNWELPGLLLGSLGYPLSVVAGEQMNSLLTDPVRRAKEEKGIVVIGPGNSYRKLYRILQDGGIVALLLDGDIFEGGVPVELFGRKVSLPRGAARLAMSTGAPVLGAYCRRISDDHSRVHIETLLSPGEAAGSDEQHALKTIYAAIERYIRDNTDQWCIFRDFWEETS